MKDRYKYGIGFWSGSGNLNHRSQIKILVYDCIITGVAVPGLILCICLLKKGKEN
jgi:hypothetical protein